MEQKQTKKPTSKKILSIIAMVLAFALTFVGGYFSKYLIDPKNATATTDLIWLIENVGIVFDENGKEKKLTKDDYLKAIADGVLDDYSRYYTEQEYQVETSQDKGDYSGFGIGISKLSSQAPIAKNVIGNSPADKAGMRKGDKITSITFNEQTTQISNSNELSNYLANFNKGDKVIFNVDRNGNSLCFEVEKAEYKATYVAYFDNEKRISFHTINGKNEQVQIVSERIEDLGANTAIISIDAFQGNVASQFATALECMKQNNRTKLILDLRDNGGGLMKAFTQVARHLIYNKGNNALVAYSKGKTENKSYYMQNPVKHDFIEKIAVLANDGTASASECLIGAMLYYGEKFSIDNLIIEKNSDGVAKTYGKGIMQTTYKFFDGSALKLTTAKILWPDKKTCIHLKGIFPTQENGTQKGLPAVQRAVQTLN